MDNLLDAMRSYATNRRSPRGAILLYQSEIPRFGFIIRKGIVRSYTITSSGEERIISLHGPGDIIPLCWVYGQTNTTLFYYEAVSDVDVAMVRKDDLMNTIRQQPELLEQALKSMANEYTALLLRITALGQSNAAEKIAMTLYYLLIRHGSERKPGLFTIDIKMTQSMIANLVGLTRESVAINLKHLKKRQIVTYSSFLYTVDKAALERYLGEDSFAEVSL